MCCVDPEAVLAVLRGADPDVMERDELVVLTSQISVLKSWCEALQVRATRRQRALADAGRSEAPRDVLSRHGRQSSRDARTADERELVCTQMPGFEDALAAGVVSAGHVDAIATVTRNLDEGQRAEFATYAEALLVDAGRQGVDVFERNCRDIARDVTATKPGATPEQALAAQQARANVKHWTDRETGMAHTHLELDPVRDRTLWTAIRTSLGKLRTSDGNRNTPWSQLEVDAVIAAVHGGSGERVPEIIVIVDDTTRCNGLHDDTICETSDGEPLPVTTVQRLCCDAETAVAHIDANGELLALGRTQRTASRAQRRALRTMYRTCAHPDCTVSIDECRVHHVRFWRHGGTSNIDNMIPLCEHHHHMVHEGGWTLTMTPDRVATWTRPDGTHHHTAPTTDRRPTGSASRRSEQPTPSMV